MSRKYGLKEAFLGWWEDWPPRRKDFWRLLLLGNGCGWLTWATVDGVSPDYYDGLGDPQPGEPYHYAPPLRRFVWWLNWWLSVPYAMLLGYKNPDTGERYRYSWEEAQPSWGDFYFYKDPDLYQELWGISKKDRAFLKRQRERRRV